MSESFVLILIFLFLIFIYFRVMKRNERQKIKEIEKKLFDVRRNLDEKTEKIQDLLESKKLEKIHFSVGVLKEHKKLENKYPDVSIFSKKILDFVEFILISIYNMDLQSLRNYVSDKVFDVCRSFIQKTRESGYKVKFEIIKISLREVANILVEIENKIRIEAVFHFNYILYKEGQNKRIISGEKKTVSADQKWIITCRYDDVNRIFLYFLEDICY